MGKLGMNLKSRLTEVMHCFFHDEEGQSTTEYILILFVVVLVALKFRNKFVTQMGTTVDSLFSKITEATQDSGN
jgi:Flp pilus assembly pilin Flp